MVFDLFLQMKHNRCTALRKNVPRYWWYQAITLYVHKMDEIHFLNLSCVYNISANESNMHSSFIKCILFFVLCVDLCFL